MDKLQSMNCRFCNADDEGCVTCLDHRGCLWIGYPNKLIVHFDDNLSEIEIRFCPICGRELKK